MINLNRLIIFLTMVKAHEELKLEILLISVISFYYFQVVEITIYYY